MAAQVGADRLDRLAHEWLPNPPREPTPPALTVPIDGAAWERLLSSIATDADGAAAERSRSRSMRLGDWSTSAVRGLVVLLTVAALLVGWWWWSGRPVAVAVAPAMVATGSALPSSPPTPLETRAPGVPPVPSALTEQPIAEAAPQADEVVVHVAGLVARPGLVRLPAGARVADAIAAAGGVTRRRGAESVNLARVVADGEQIVVTLKPPPATGATLGTPMSGGALSPLDLNTASVGQLEGLPGVGPVLAGRIAQWRSDNGSFRSVDELGEVPGIGESTLAELRPLVHV